MQLVPERVTDSALVHRLGAIASAVLCDHLTTARGSSHPLGRFQKFETMGREQLIEDQIIANLPWFGYRGASWIRRVKLGREGFGAVDLLLLPESGRHRVVLIEVKHADSKDTPGRLVGQLLAYYLACLRLGAEGLDCLRTFANGPDAHHTRGKSLQMLSGLGRGSKHQDLQRLRSGDPITPEQVALLIVIGTDDASGENRESLSELRAWLWSRGRLDIPVAIARSDGSFVWAARPNKDLQPSAASAIIRRRS
jgi:hypothetical protein